MCVCGVSVSKFLCCVVHSFTSIHEAGASAQDAFVFSSGRVAFEFTITLAQRDLEYRGFRDERAASFLCRAEAIFRLFQKVRDCQDEHEYALLQQSWGAANRPEYVQRVWADNQQEALAMLEQAVSYDDEEVKRVSRRWLYIKGRPCSG